MPIVTLHVTREEMPFRVGHCVVFVKGIVNSIDLFSIERSRVQIRAVHAVINVWALLAEPRALPAGSS